MRVGKPLAGRRRSARRGALPPSAGARGGGEMPGEEEEEAEAGPGGPAATSPAPCPSPPAEEWDTRQRYEELCGSLNMDERARAEAWLSYQGMRRNYTLEVRGGRAGRGPAEGQGRVSGPLPPLLSGLRGGGAPWPCLWSRQKCAERAPLRPVAACPARPRLVPAEGFCGRV